MQQVQLFISCFLGVLLHNMKASMIEVVVTKYQALDYTETRDVAHERYSFSFCLCLQPTGHPNTDPSCECKMNRLGKTAVESIPKVIFPSSCLYSSNDDKCLTASFGLLKNARYLYVSVRIGTRMLTAPDWQSLQFIRYKKTVKLASRGSSKFIELTYSVLGDKDDNEINPTRREHNTIAFAPNAQTHAKSNRLEALQRINPYHRINYQQVNQRGRQTVIITETRQQEEPSHHNGPNYKLQNTKNIRDITLYLMELGLQQRINPPNFNIEGFKQAVLQSHNRYRSLHDAPPLSYDMVAEREAQNWAQNLASRQICIDHDPKRIYGESLFYFGFQYFTDPTSMAEAVTHSFYLESEGYTYNNIPYDYYNRGHFTQMVWASSRKMGVGVSISYFNGRRTNACQPGVPAYLLYIVIKYDPPGNERTKRAFLDNVRPATRKL